MNLKGMNMREQYRSLVESIISHEDKLRLSQEMVHKAEQDLARARGFVEFNKASIKTASDSLAEIEQKAFGG